MRRRSVSLGKILPRNLNEKQIAKVASALLEGSSQKSSRPLYIKGVRNGRFYRVKLEDASVKSKKPSHLVPLPGPPMPHAFKNVTHHHGKAKSGSSSGGSYSFKDYWIWMKEWSRENWPTVVLNAGSVATLVGFTRSDVLELRMLSVTGSTANVIYHFSLSPLRYLPVCWSGLFATVNAIKIREILLERHSDVHMTEEQEDIFIEFFMPHGITPRQFQVLQETAEQVVIPKGGAIIRQGEPMSHVSLVVSGNTRASISGRRLTAASCVAPKFITEEKAGGNSGAWIGEMTFLETYWKKEEKKRKTRKIPVIQQSAVPAKEVPSEKVPSDSQRTGAEEKKTEEVAAATTIQTNDSVPTTAEDQPVAPKSGYTIVAASECVVWRWKFEEMESMMEKSTDFRAALSRAMTSAIVSKVVNFTVSKTAALPTWSTWLDDWRYNAGAKVNVKMDVDDVAVEEKETTAEEDDDSDFDQMPAIA